MLNIFNNKHILRAVFVFNAETLEIFKCYNGVMECAKSLNLSASGLITILLSI